MIQHNFPSEHTIESISSYLISLNKTINLHSVLLNHYLSHTLHINTSPQAINYLSQHPDNDLMKYLQSLYSFSIEDFNAFTSHTTEIASQEDSTKEQLIQMSPEAFEIAVDCSVGRIPPSPLLPIIANLAAQKQLSDIKVRYVEERLPVPYSVALVKNKTDEYGGIDEKYIKQVIEWTATHKAEVVYNSDVNGRDTLSLNRSLCNRTNFSIFIVTGTTDVFGSFHGKSISSPPKSRWEAVQNDDKFFVFTCKNSFGIPMTRYLPNETSDSLIIFPNRGINLFTIFGCYQIGQFECSPMKKREFIKNFKDAPPCGTELFSGLRNDKFVAQKIIVFQLE
ncbi:hypothetical protein EHI8A_239360 [Entamoeba histolytica HM-1:IMSS-B]|uniref:TLDc domain-containing protein n=6 Tax=Entamoeba histolytica TaxID=5759 RepID=C4M475_ENTH1|nr:hypothetical protein EHI_140270 [Entamoeba histolytica HM-1:IMSS]EMD43780.1 Hypothetical protein EHI5A_257190 [Entamoeba histolytica KU27]EMH75490.1 hypothetical protein EHI8A_239360 [Entamoeba histolytica HM-1:IMSS-B]EMS12377.1 hypothetical protein KM1_031490 [Entamoeba histolytica HM-3:IMSS]ENY61941.1 hypothetical protein EHI7A_192560 [Entamoeba histolytica HM-1:IMSS-A]GAT96155.1 hypothetical protein CL6EHI_140270 [Entamoeba histolytica]|eukprot:XP_656752.1 hypothetical protein EHI_140270 [Entamoeba histolytica HM-1:IMSS]